MKRRKRRRKEIGARFGNRDMVVFLLDSVSSTNGQGTFILNGDTGKRHGGLLRVSERRDGRDGRI
jgi:hypothetical protein